MMANKFYPSVPSGAHPDFFEHHEPIDLGTNEFENMLSELMLGYGFKSVVSYLKFERKYTRADARKMALHIQRLNAEKDGSNGNL
jgi:hypothetical protein